MVTKFQISCYNNLTVLCLRLIRFKLIKGQTLAVKEEMYAFLNLFAAVANIQSLHS